MDYRNPAYNHRGTIDCEINHPVYGWIPFTADPDDTGAQFDVAALHAAILADPTLQPYVAPPDPVIVPEIVAKLALVRAMRMVTLQGGPAGAGPSAWDAVKAALAAAPEAAQEDWQLATHMPRADPMLNAMAGALGASGATLDAVFVLADQIDRGEVTP